MERGYYWLATLFLDTGWVFSYLGPLESREVVKMSVEGCNVEVKEGKKKEREKRWVDQKSRERVAGLLLRKGVGSGQ